MCFLLFHTKIPQGLLAASRVDQDGGKGECVKGGLHLSCPIMASHGLGSKSGSTTSWAGAFELDTSLSQPQFPHYQMRSHLSAMVANRPSPPLQRSLPTPPTLTESQRDSPPVLPVHTGSLKPREEQSLPGSHGGCCRWVGGVYGCWWRGSLVGR